MGEKKIQIRIFNDPLFGYIMVLFFFFEHGIKVVKMLVHLDYVRGIQSADFPPEAIEKIILVNFDAVNNCWKYIARDNDFAIEQGTSSSRHIGYGAGVTRFENAHLLIVFMLIIAQLLFFLF